MQKDNFHECVICLEEMKTGEELTVIRCSHIYHSHCIQTWANKKPSELLSGGREGKGGRGGRGRGGRGRGY